MPDITLSTLQDIRIKVRRLTRSPSDTQITDAQLDDYINTFVLYDFPEQLKIFSLRRTFSFYSEPYIDRYETNTVDINSPMYNFKNKYLSVHKQITIAGFPTMLSESREQFYGIYPMTFSINAIAYGDGITTNFAGILTNAQIGFGGGFVPIIRGEVLFSSVDINNNGLSVVDQPIAGSAVGNLVVPDNPAIVGFINYITGQYDFTFPVAPQASQSGTVYSQTIPFVPARPQAMLYFDDAFILRPVPNMPYKITVEVFVRPTELLAGADMPDLSQWWQFIAYGAAKKIFEDRMDTESVQMILPEYKNQERLVLRRTIMNDADQRTSTIYTEQVDISSGISGWGGNNV